MEEILNGFTCILGAPDTRKLQMELHAGLNRLQHQLWKQPSGLSASKEWEYELLAVNRAWVVVVFATPAFCRSSRGKRLMEAADAVRRGVITIWKRRPKPG